jgi:hypothetical protein
VVSYAEAPVPIMDIEMLINESYLRPVLWDTSTDYYKNKNKKTTVWRGVACAVFKDMKKNTEADANSKSVSQILQLLMCPQNCPHPILSQNCV